MTLAEMQAKHADIMSRAKAIKNGAEAMGRDMSDDEVAKVKALLDEADSLKANVDKAKDKLALGDRLKNIEIPDAIKVPAAAIEAIEAQFDLIERVKIPVSAQAFRPRFVKDAKVAYAFGAWFLGARGNKRAAKIAQDLGLGYSAVHNEDTNTTGGYLVPAQFEAMLIDLREQYGVFRRNTRVMPMGGDTLMIPRDAGRLTAYAVGESVAITESTKTFDQVELVARKWGVLTRISSELSEDAAIAVGDLIARDIAWAFANKEDDCAFNGDGSSTYHKITGIRQRLVDVFTTSGGTGLVDGTGNLYSELVLTDFEAVCGALPVYADGPNVAWYAHKKFYYTVMKKLELAAGGATATEIATGGNRGRPLFLGYPVEFTQVMPSTEANDQVCAILGNLPMGSKLGDRRGTTITASNAAYVNSVSTFEVDQTAIRGTTRFDINIHDVGVSGTAGPIVGLKTKGS